MFRICQIDRVGAIDRVEFDLRSNLLSPSEWVTIPLRTRLRNAQEAPQSEGPFLWFPWFGPYGDTQPGRKPDAIVNTGDKVVIASVERANEGDDFDHPHDVEVRRAYLRIERKNGEVDQIPVPLEYTGLSALRGPGFSGDPFENLKARILEHFGLEELDGDVGSDEPAIALEALRLACILEAATGRIRELSTGIPLLSDGHSDRSDERLVAMDVMAMVNASVRLGYLWAKVEAEGNMKPLAKSASRSKVGASRGGTKSALSRTRKRAEGWEPIAKEAAKERRAKDPSISQEKLAGDIDTYWKSEEHKAPGLSTLKALIARMERHGELPRRERRNPSTKGLKLTK